MKKLLVLASPMALLCALGYLVFIWGPAQEEKFPIAKEILSEEEIYLRHAVSWQHNPMIPGTEIAFYRSGNTPISLTKERYESLRQVSLQEIAFLEEGDIRIPENLIPYLEITPERQTQIGFMLRSCNSDHHLAIPGKSPRIFVTRK